MLPGPPTLYHSLLAYEDKCEAGVAARRGDRRGDIPVELIRRIHDELPFQSIMTGYGLTECGTATLSRPGDSFDRHRDHRRAVACDGIDVRIADDGEVLVRGYSVMQGYLDDPTATAEAVDPDGWLHTGDLGTLDDAGRLRIVGRKKDMFIVGGFNAYPAEIEGFLLEHPAVAQAAVIGVPDERMGQVGRAFVVRSGGRPSDRRGTDRVEPRTGWRDSKCRAPLTSSTTAAQRHGQGHERPAALLGNPGTQACARVER